MVLKHVFRRTPLHHGNIHLCDACDSAFTGKRHPEKHNMTGHHDHPDDFFQAVEKEKCWACYALRAQLCDEQYAFLKTYRPNWNDMQPPPGYFTWMMVADISDPAVVGPRGSMEFHIYFGGGLDEKLQQVGLESKWNVIYPALFLWAQPMATVDRTKLSTPAGDDTFTVEAWSTAKKWIHACLTDHVACNDSRSTTYPTRLIDVGTDGEKVRLIETAETAHHGEYVTLSHCWGSEPFLTLQEHNLEAMKSEISISSLSKTFQDAIQVTRRLSIRYIWIDSLCIIQNEPGLADWERESVKMGDYYSNAFCNISATASSSGAKGLRRRRDHIALLHAEYNMPAARHGRLAGPYSISNVSLWAIHLDEAPLHRRAWCLQERLLARRVLHFGDGQLLWECREQTASEMYPTGLPKIAALQLRSRFKNLDPASPSNQKRFESADRGIVARQLWHHISKEYSRCLLTYPKDKTRALEGVVKLFEGIIQDQYVQGFWEQGLDRQLLWRVQDSLYPPPNRLYKVQHTYPIPSWSWLSSDCPLLLRENPPGSTSIQNEEMLYTVSEILPPNTLILKCRLRHAELQLTTYGMFKVDEFTDFGKLEAFKLSDVYLDGLLDEIKKAGDTLSCLVMPARIIYEIRHAKSETPVMLFESFILKAHEEAGTYKRIGLLRVQDEPKAVEALLEGRLGGPEVLSRGYDSETGRHEIALI